MLFIVMIPYYGIQLYLYSYILDFFSFSFFIFVGDFKINYESGVGVRAIITMIFGSGLIEIRALGSLVSQLIEQDD